MAARATKARTSSKNSHGVSLGTVLDLVGEARSAQQRREEPLVVEVAVAADAPREAALAVKKILMPEQATATVGVFRMGARPAAEEADLAVVVSGTDGHEATDAAVAWAGRGVPCAIVCESALDAVEPMAPGPVRDLVSHVFGSDGSALAEGLGEWALSACDKDIALAAAFPAFRGLVARRLTGRCAATCAGIGAVEFLHGADIVLMGVSQAKLALDIAACYGRPADVSRALEVGGVAGLALAWREVSRALTSFAPGVSRLIKAGVGYAGTMATGRALQARFELEDGGAAGLAAGALKRVRSVVARGAHGGDPDDTLVRPLPVAAPPQRPRDGGRRDAPSGYITLEG